MEGFERKTDNFTQVHDRMMIMGRIAWDRMSVLWGNYHYLVQGLQRGVMDFNFFLFLLVLDPLSHSPDLHSIQPAHWTMDVIDALIWASVVCQTLKKIRTILATQLSNP